jgi:hypothetical protein
MELKIHGERFSVGSMGLNGLVVRAPVAVSAGAGQVTLNVGGKVTVYHVMLTSGIDPLRNLQPFELLSSKKEVAA